MLGGTIAHYRIVSQLGHGGMGEVYLAEDVRLGHRVAIKVLPEPIAQEREARTRFLREAQAIATIEHPNILPLHEFNEVDGKFFLVTPYLERGSVRDVLRNSRGQALPLDLVLRWGVELADGLAAAHDQGIIHRDIKPDNLLLTNADSLQIADFGLAHLDDATQVTRTGMTMGTISYASPEQLSGKTVDHRTDLFSVGVTLYELLSGRAPFARSNRAAIMHAITDEEPIPLDQLRDDVPSALSSVVSQLLAKDVTRRIQSAEELGIKLRAIAASAGVDLHSTPRPAPRPRRRPSLRVLIAVVSIACVLVVAWAVRTLRQPPPPPPEPHVNRLVVFPFQVRGQDELQYLGAAMVDLLTTKLDGAGPLYCVNAHTTLSALSRKGLDVVTPASAREVASGFGASIYIMGSIVEVGEDVQLNGMLFETGAENGPTATASVQGDADGLPALVDGLAMELLAAHVSETEGELPEIAARTTESLPALKAYLQGLQLGREGRFLEAVESFQRAVQADSTFALAWLKLAGTVNASPRASSAGIDQQHALEQAKRFMPKLPAKLRLEMEAGELGGIWRGCPSSADAKRSVSLRRRILINYPNDAALWGALGVHLRWWAPMWGQPMDQAREALERSLTLENNFMIAAYLSDIYAIEGNEAKYDSLWQHAVDTSEWSEDNDFSFVFRLEAAFYEGDSRAQAEVMAELEAYIDSPFRMFTSMYAVGRGSVWPFVRNVMSEDVPALWTKSDNPSIRAFSHLCLALLRGSRGQWQSAQSQFESARSSHDGYALLVEALASMAPMRELPHSRLQALDARLETATEEELRVPFFREDGEGYAELRRLFVRGLLAVRLGELERAFRFAQMLEESAAIWEKATVQPPPGELELQMFARIVRGEAMAAQGHLEDALDELNECTPYLPRSSVRMSGNIALGLLRYRRAELSQELGRAHEALRWYDTICMAQMSMFHEVPFLAPSCFQRARVYDQLGDFARALRHYSEFLDLWKECDPELEIWVQTARSRVADLRSMGT